MTEKLKKPGARKLFNHLLLPEILKAGSEMFLVEVEDKLRYYLRETDPTIDESYVDELVSQNNLECYLQYMEMRQNGYANNIRSKLPGVITLLTPEGVVDFKNKCKSVGYKVPKNHIQTIHGKRADEVAIYLPNGMYSACLEEIRFHPNVNDYLYDMNLMANSFTVTQTVIKRVQGENDLTLWINRMHRLDEALEEARLS